MQHLTRFVRLGLLALVSACSSAPQQDSPKLAHQPESLDIPYTQDWEAGAGDWSSAQGEAVTLTSDATSPAGSSVQQLDRATSGGDYFSPYLPIVGGQTYCVSAKIKWVSGAAPFVGLERLAGTVSKGVSWLFGAAYTDMNGSTQEISSTPLGWQNPSRTVVIPAGVTRVRLIDELYVNSSKGGVSLSYFDGLSITDGACSYAQDWESGTRGWVDSNGQVPTLVNDPTSPAGSTVQQITSATAGGNFSRQCSRLQMAKSTAYERELSGRAARRLSLGSSSLRVASRRGLAGCLEPSTQIRTAAR